MAIGSSPHDDGRHEVRLDPARPDPARPGPAVGPGGDAPVPVAPTADAEHHLSAGDLTGLAKVVAVSSVRIGVWATVTGLNAGRRTVDAVRHPEQAAELAEDLRVAAAAITRALVGEEVEHKVRAAAAANPVVRVVADAVETVAPHPAEDEPAPVDPLHQAGQELLRRSRDVWSDDRGHPAYARIIHELAPDEARILLLLLRRGPQPAVDVRTGGLVGTVSSNLVKANLTMIGALAGCRHVDRVPSYLHNLERLGLIWFSRETLRDPEEYQVLEAQPGVLEARGSVRRSKVVRRSIHLTPFGEDFCRDGLGLHLTDADREGIPRHSRPGEG
jgi:Abortive infection alpha